VQLEFSNLDDADRAAAGHRGLRRNQPTSCEVREVNVLRRLTGIAAAGVLVAAQVATSGLPAFADDGGSLLLDVPGDSQGFVHDTSTPMLNFLKLAPGYSTIGDVQVKNDSTHTAQLALQATDVAEDENGCNGPETRSGDTSCDTAGGELGAWLRVTVSRETDGSQQTLWSGGLSDLASGVVLADEMPAGAVWPIQMKVELPYAAGNDTQTDRVGFGLKWTASADTGESSQAEVKGIEAFAPGSGGGSSSGGGITLPFTGTAISPALLALDLGVLFAGGLLILASRRRRLS
jgi:hypothetical protein